LTAFLRIKVIKWFLLAIEKSLLDSDSLP
jgi:hypothetical protein